jgi:hypothetical protein
MTKAAAKGGAPGRLHGFGAITILLIGAAAYGGYRFVRYMMLPGSDLHSRATIERYTHVKIPAGAKDLNCFIEGWQDPIVYLRFTVPREELDAFLSTTAAESPLTTESIPDAFVRPLPQGGRSWWTPGRPARFRAGSGERTYTGSDEDGDYSEDVKHYVLVDETDPARPTVWFTSQ